MCYVCISFAVPIHKYVQFAEPADAFGNHKTEAAFASVETHEHTHIYMYFIHSMQWTSFVDHKRDLCYKRYFNYELHTVALFFCCCCCSLFVYEIQT